jgi:hypothetical protein
MLTFEHGVDSNKYSEGFGFNHLYAQSPCNPQEDYADIFYMTDEGDIPSIQYMTSLRLPLSMSKIGGLLLIFITFYVPAPTPVSIALRPRCSFLRT